MGRPERRRFHRPRAIAAGLRPARAATRIDVRRGGLFDRDPGAHAEAGRGTAGEERLAPAALDALARFFRPGTVHGQACGEDAAASGAARTGFRHAVAPRG